MAKVPLIMTALLLAGLLSCTKGPDSAPTQQSRVSSTKSYERYFGPAPTTDKGICYAFVIYFPSAKVPGKVVPFPFFSFDQASLKKVAVQRLMGGMADVKSYRGEILQPFPTGSHLLGISEKEGVITVNFSSELLRSKPDEETSHALVNALVLTLKQFSDVKDVRIQVDGKESLFDKVPRGTDEAVLQPSPPRLLSITAVKEKGAKDVEEVDAFFDRPVNIKLLQMNGADGKAFQGDIYQSVFDMAGVLKPKAPTVFAAGMPIKARWSVTDKMGRSASGDAIMPLEVKEQ